MGASYIPPLSQWSHGEYPGATNPDQDDLDLITDASANRARAQFITADGYPYGGATCPQDGADPDAPQPGGVFFERATVSAT